MFLQELYHSLETTAAGGAAGVTADLEKCGLVRCKQDVENGAGNVIFAGYMRTVPCGDINGVY